MSKQKRTYAVEIKIVDSNEEALADELQSEVVKFILLAKSFKKAERKMKSLFKKSDVIFEILSISKVDVVIVN